jgi:hypothetical protein
MQRRSSRNVVRRHRERLVKRGSVRTGAAHTRWKGGSEAAKMSAEHASRGSPGMSARPRGSGGEAQAWCRVRLAWELGKRREGRLGGARLGFGFRVGGRGR